jgi:protoheme IX farnesyltransferase
MRLGVSLAVSFSALTGYIIASSTIDFELSFVFIGVFLMAGGASALNQYQERQTDALMLRTKNRPIPSGKISSIEGLLISLALSLLGFLVLWVFLGYIPALLGLINMIWYNGLYTYLKKKTAFAVVPGSLTGVTPILIGWSAAGAHLLNPTIIFVSFFIYLWQIPHFWLLHIKYADDYEKAGLGGLNKLFSYNQIKRVIFSWIIATSLISLLIPYFGIIRTNYLAIILVISNFCLVFYFYKSLFHKHQFMQLKKAFISINAFMIIIMTLLIVEYLF